MISHVDASTCNKHPLLNCHAEPKVLHSLLIMNAEQNIKTSGNPFPDPFEEPQAIPSQTLEAAERLKQAAGKNVRRLQKAAEAGIKTFQSSTGEPGNSPPDNTETATWEDLQSKFKELHREGEEWARENPTTAILTAAGAGFILGLLFKS